MKKLILLCSTAAVFLPSTAFAQSTGTVVTEEEETIVVTGARTREVEGVQIPDSPKARAVITQELISKQSPGQTILNTINLVPGVNFTQSDAYGSAGGNIRIRGFDGNRISLTFDGLPLNDTGNYAIFSNQQLDPELIEQVNVNLGTTDVDSPTASAAGGTVNYRTILPSRRPGGRVVTSIGDHDYYRVFGIAHSGDITSSGLRAFIAGSAANNSKFKGPGQIYKRQVNGRVYQPIGSNGDFISVAGHYNTNRNNFYRNPSITDLRNTFGTSVFPSTGVTPANPLRVGYFNESQQDTVETIENDRNCVRPLPNAAGNRASDPTCTNYYNVRVNPSDTGNVRMNSRFTLTDGLLITFDPSYQYTLAHGGGITRLAENSPRARGRSGRPGIDFNGDGDVADTVNFFTPNITNTHRYGLTSSLIWEVNNDHRVRVAYTFDRGRHRQTGEWGFLQSNGDPENIFSGRNGTPVLNADGFQLQQRDRKSIALLNQISGQYIGRFLDRKLRVEVGVRRPFFKRELQTFCPIQATDGFAYCTSENILPRGTALVNQPSSVPNRSIPIFINQGDVIPPSGTGQIGRAYNFVFAPFKAEYKFGKLLPNVGFTYSFDNPVSVFGSYAKGYSAPRTDNLYNAPVVDVKPEQTDAFDLGVRYTTGRVQAQLSGWLINYQNRIVSSFDPDLGISIDRNVGKVESHGFDGSVAVQPLRWLSVIGLVSYIDSELQENVQVGALAAGVTSCGDSETPPAGCAPTAGKKVTEQPTWQYGGRLSFDFDPVSFGVQAKRVGPRFATDVNDVKVKGYTTVDLDARVALPFTGLRDTYLQFNLLNAFNEFYFGNLSTRIQASDNPNFTVGAPRTFMASLSLGI